MNEKTKQRSQIAEKDKWNIEALYKDMTEWRGEVEKICNLDQKPRWPKLLSFQNKLGSGPETLKDFLDFSFSLDQKLSRLLTYAHMRYDEDLGDEENKKANGLIQSLYQDFTQEISWAEPELLQLSENILKNYLQHPILREYQFYLNRLLRMKPYTLSADKEAFLAMLRKTFKTPQNTFSAFQNADLSFPDIQDAGGEKFELTLGKFGFYLRQKDRELRKNAFQTLLTTFKKFENTLCELLKGQIEQKVFLMKARGYSSCLEASLFPNQIDPRVYLNLIQTVRRHLPLLHHYMKLRKKALKLDVLHLYDLYVPIVEDKDWSLDYSKAVSLIIESVAPLGKDYQTTLAKGLQTERWVDRYENLRKRSGAYSSGSYGTMPYILMNYQGTFPDLMTLAHEAGHSMHSFLSHKNQPYHYSDYPIFLAEVASTFNEELLFSLLLQKEKEPRRKAFLINQKLEDIRATFFRQTLFAEFELKVHQLVEQDIPLTPGLLKEIYRGLNREYFGNEVFVDEEIEIEWARIPHFYTNFYVYQYATGISAAFALFETGKEKGNYESYLHFLSSGSSNYPIELLKNAGVDMEQKEPIEATIKQFDQLLSQLSTLL